MSRADLSLVSDLNFLLINLEDVVAYVVAYSPRTRLNLFAPEDVLSWRAIVAADVYTRNHFSESMGSRLGGPGQMALQTMSEFTLYVNFLLIPLSKICSFDVAAKDL